MTWSVIFLWLHFLSLCFFAESGLDLFLFILPRICWASWMCGLISFIRMRNILSLYLFKYWLCPNNIHILFLSHYNQMCARFSHCILHVSYSLSCIFYFISSLHKAFLIMSSGLSSNSLMLSSLMSTFLPDTFTELVFFTSRSYFSFFPNMRYHFL